MESTHNVRNPLPLGKIVAGIARSKLGIEIESSQVEIVSLAVGLRKGQWALLGQLFTDFTEDDIKLGLQRTEGWQTTNVLFLPFEERSLFRFIDGSDHCDGVKRMPYLEVGLGCILRYAKDHII